jgi:hypothetical protein
VAEFEIGDVVLVDSAFRMPIRIADDASPPSEDDHLVPGKRYIVFAIGNDDRTQLATKDSPLRFERCGVQEETSFLSSH